MSASRPPLPSPALAASAVLLVTLTLAGCGSADNAAPPAAPRPVLVATVVQAPLGGLSFAGEVRARERAELAFAVAGVVREVRVEPGATVRRGQLLARIDTTPQQAQLAAADAEGQRLQAALAEAQRRETRVKAARDSGAASESEWTAIQAEVQSARAALAAAQAQRSAAAWSREQTELRAPFDGRVAMRQLEIGQAVGAGAPVLAVEGRGRELWLAVPASLALKVGQTVKMQGPAGEASGRVQELGARLEAGGARRVLLSAPDAWPTGEAVAVQLWPADGNAALQVPLRAVQLDPTRPGQGQVLRLPVGKSVPEPVAVQLGAMQGEHVEVRSGLKPGEQVVLAGGQSLAASQPVTAVSRLR